MTAAQARALTAAAPGTAAIAQMDANITAAAQRGETSIEAAISTAMYSYLETNGFTLNKVGEITTISWEAAS